MCRCRHASRRACAAFSCPRRARASVRPALVRARAILPSDDLPSAWSKAVRLKMQLADAVALQSFETAARLRDELQDIELSAMQLIELDCVHQLETGTQQERRESLSKLSQLSVCDETQECIAKLLKDEDLSGDAESTLQRLWFRHPDRDDINSLMHQGTALLSSAAGLSGALERFRTAAKKDPMFAEAWNKVATVLYLQNECASVTGLGQRVPRTSQYCSNSFGPHRTMHKCLQSFRCCRGMVGAYLPERDNAQSAVSSGDQLAQLCNSLVAYRYAESVEICERVLHLNPLHYACLAGKGLCHRCLREDDKAMECFEGALAIHPFLNEVRSQLAEMKARQTGGSFQST